MSRLAAGLVLDQAGKAASAALMAAMASSLEAEADFQRTLPVEGSVTSKVFVVWTSIPFIWRGIVWTVEALEAPLVEPLVAMVLEVSVRVVVIFHRLLSREEHD